MAGGKPPVILFECVYTMDFTSCGFYETGLNLASFGSCTSRKKK